MPSRLIQKKTLYFSVAMAFMASAAGCSSGGGDPPPFPGASSGGGSGSSTGGKSGSGGSTSSSGGGSGSSTGGSTGSSGGTSGGTGGTTPAGTGGTTPAGTGGTTPAGTGGTTPAGTGGTTGTDGGVTETGTPPGGGPGMPVTAVFPSAGCGKAPPAGTGVQTIATMGVKPPDAADSKKGPWMYDRQYSIRMPAAYDNKRAYNLIFQGGGCNGGGPNFPYSYNASVDNSAIMVALGLPPTSIGHAEVGTGTQCYDDKDKYSIEIEFYEALYDRLDSQYCFDRNRVFIGGNSSGGWLSNELGCKYAGDPKRPIRAFMPNTGGLPMPDKNRPPCSDKPRSGFWVHERNDPDNPFTGNKFAVQEAMKVNKCMIGTTFDNTMFADYPVPGLQANTCKKIMGCPDLYPLIVCDLPGNAHGSHTEVVNPGGNTFVKMFSNGAFLTK